MRGSKERADTTTAKRKKRRTSLSMEVTLSEQAEVFHVSNGFLQTWPIAEKMGNYDTGHGRCAKIYDIPLSYVVNREHVTDMGYRYIIFGCRLVMILLGHGARVFTLVFALMGTALWSVLYLEQRFEHVKSS